MRRTFAATMAIGFGIDLLSFIGWGVPRIAPLLTVAVLCAVAALAFRDLRWGVAAVLLELFWGGHGYLLRIPAQGLDLSLRVGLTFVVLAASLWRLREDAARRQLIRALRTHPARWTAFVFLATLLLGLLLGALRHPWDRVFFDANAWGFLALAPAFLLVYTTGHARLLNIFLAGAAYLILRTYFLLFAFSHDLAGTWIPLYQWVRDTRLGEITVFPGGFPRVFLPSMALLFPAVLLVLQSVWSLRGASPGADQGERYGNPDHRERMVIAKLVFGGGIAVLTVSLSRSYWLAGATLIAIGLALVIVRTVRQRTHRSLVTARASDVHLSQFRTKLRKVFRDTFVWGGAVAVALLIVFAVVRVPYPQRLTSAGIGGTFLARFSSDAAVSNRWQQLGPLWDMIRTHLVFGNGFGAAVTYASKDPRTIATSPDGRYTTTAFEWGYLDDLFERGILGLIVELWFIGALIWFGIRRGGYALRSSSEGGETAALALGLLAIALVHVASPYLNHPLGIGVAMLLFASITSTDEALTGGIRS